MDVNILYNIYDTKCVKKPETFFFSDKKLGN